LFYGIDFVIAGLLNQMRFRRGGGSGCLRGGGGGGGCDGGSRVRWQSWRLPKTTAFTFSRRSIGASVSAEDHVPLSSSRPIFSSLVEDPFVLLCLRHNRNKSSLHEDPTVASVMELDEEIDFFDPVVQENQLKNVFDDSLLPEYLQLEVGGQEDSKCLESTWVTEFPTGALQVIMKQTLPTKIRETMLDHHRHHDDMHQYFVPGSDEWEAGHEHEEEETTDDEGEEEDDDNHYILLSSSSGSSACYPEDVHFSSCRTHGCLSSMDSLIPRKQPVVNSVADENPLLSSSILSESCKPKHEPVEDEFFPAFLPIRVSSSILSESSKPKQEPVEDDFFPAFLPTHVPSCSWSEDGLFPAFISDHGPRNLNDGVEATSRDLDILGGNYGSNQEQVGSADRRVSTPTLNPSEIKGVLDEVKMGTIVHHKNDKVALDELTAILDEEGGFPCSNNERVEAPDISMFFQTGESGQSTEEEDSSIYQELTEFLEDAFFQEAPGNNLEELVKELRQYEKVRQRRFVRKEREEGDWKQPVKEDGEGEGDFIGKAKETLTSLLESIKGPIDRKIEVPTINKDMWLSTIEENLDRMLFPEFQSSSTRDKTTKKRRSKASRRSNAKRGEVYRANASVPLKQSIQSKAMDCYEQINGVPFDEVETVESRIPPKRDEHQANTSLPLNKSSKSSRVMYCHEQVNGVPFGMVETVDNIIPANRDEQYEALISLPLNKSNKSKVMYCYEQVNGVPLGTVETVENFVAAKRDEQYQEANTCLPVKKSASKSKVMYCYEQINGVPLGRVETVDSIIQDGIVASLSSSSSVLSSVCTGDSTAPESNLGKSVKSSTTTTTSMDNDNVGPEDEIVQDNEDEIMHDTATNVIKLFWRYEESDDDHVDEPWSTEDPLTDYTSADYDDDDQQSLSTNGFSVSTEKSKVENFLGKKKKLVEMQQQGMSQNETRRGYEDNKGRQKQRRFGLRRLPSKLRHLLLKHNSGTTSSAAGRHNIVEQAE
jgi:hypothetical protein